jgi:hypothetical protein
MTQSRPMLVWIGRNLLASQHRVFVLSWISPLARSAAVFAKRMISPRPFVAEANGGGGS